MRFLAECRALPRGLGLGAVLVLLGALVPTFPLGAAEAPARPNIVFILVDDLGVDWVGAYGASHPTPQIDRLARGGLRFETAWTSPICTPSRVMMLTGLYPGRTGWTEHYDVPRWGGAGLMAGRFESWPRRLRDLGYATAIAGKWQINDLRTPADVLSQHGFDRHCVWPGVESNNPPSERRYWGAYLQTDGQRRIHAGQYGPDVTHTYALDFIRENRAKPFVLYYPMILVHAPNEPTPLNRERPPEGEDQLYAGSVTYMDRQVGELLDELERLGIDEKTVVILAGDNGSSSSGTLAGRAIPAGKGRTVNWGVRVPLIVRAPMMPVRGQVTNALTDFSDILPSLYELAGLPAPHPSAIDGRSWVPLLRADPGYRGRDWIYAQRHEARTIRDRRYKFNSDGGFFDLETDPDEKRPLDIEANSELSKIRDRLFAALARIPAAGPPPFPDYSAERMREHMEKNQAARPRAK